jgi:hypothetical protein
MPAPQFGITPGLKILPSSVFHSSNNMIGRKRKRSRHLGVAKKTGTGRRRHSFKRRRRRRKRKHPISVHPALLA